MDPFHYKFILLLYSNSIGFVSLETPFQLISEYIAFEREYFQKMRVSPKCFGKVLATNNHQNIIIKCHRAFSLKQVLMDFKENNWRKPP